MLQPSALLALYASFFFFLILCPSDQEPGKLVAIGRYGLPTTGPSLTIGIAADAGKAQQKQSINQLTPAGVGRHFTRALDKGVVQGVKLRVR